MNTAEYPVWLAVLPDQRDAARADGGQHPDGRSAIAWDKEAQLWYARPGADLSRIQKWLPDRSIRSSGGGDPQTEFLDALNSAGLVLNGMPVMDGQRHRVATLEDKPGAKSGVYRGFLDGVKPGGWFINYHRAENEKDITRWKVSSDRGDADPLARVHIRAVMRQSQDDFAREQAALYAQQTAKAKALFDRLPAADPAHGYLARKGITVADDIRQTRNGALVVPFRDADGAFRTLQYIPPDGEKFLFKDAPKAGHFRVEGGELHNGDPILYAEGYATARSLFMLTGRPVVMTIDAGNMVAVAGVLKARYPDSPHLFMADVDHAKEKNKGVLSANRAAAATAGAVLLPDLTAAEIERGFTDFNDLHQFRGAERLRTTLLPDIAQALEQLNHKDSPMATPDDAQPAPDNIPATSPDAAEATPARRPGAAKEKTDEILKLRDEGLKPSQIAEQLGIGQTSVYRILKAQQPEAAPATPSAPAAADVTASGVKDSPAASAVVQNMPEPEPSQRDSAVTVDATPAPELVVTAPVPEPRAASDKDASGVAPLSEPAAPEAPPVPETPAANPSVAAASESAPSDPYQNFTGLYGAGAELRDRLAALASGQISPAALLDDIRTLRSRVDGAATADVYTREHVREMQQVFDRVTQGGMAGADVTDTGTFSRLRGLLGRRDTWDSLHPTGGPLDLNTVTERVSVQYAMLAQGEVTRAQFDREVRMLHGEFTRADPASFATGQHEATRVMFERMSSLESPERAAQYTAGIAPSVAQLSPASATDPNASALYRIQTALRDEFVSMARGERQEPALMENVARLKAQLDEAQAQGVYADSHVREIQGSFDRLTKDGLAVMPSPETPQPRGDYASRFPASASLDVSTVPARIEAQYDLLVRGDVTRAEFEDNLVVLRNEVSRLSEAGLVSPADLATAEGSFTHLAAQPASPAAVVPSPGKVAEPAVLPESSPLQPAVPSPLPAAAIAPSAAVTPEPVTSVEKVSEPLAPVDSPVVSPAVVSTEPEPVHATSASAAVIPEPVASVAKVSEPPAPVDSPVVSPAVTSTEPEPVYEAAASAQDAPAADTTSASPFTAAPGEENAILVGAARMTPSDDNTPAADNTARIDADKLLSRVTHEKQADGKSVLYRLDGEPAFYDHGNRLVMAEGTSSQEDKVLAALLTASQYYHGRIELTGSDEFKAYAMSVIVANNLDVSMKNASQQADLEAARRAAGLSVTASAPADAIRGDQVAPRAESAPPVSTDNAPVQKSDAPVHDNTAVTPSPKRDPAAVTSPAASKIQPAIHTPAEKAREPVTGKVTACGQAPYRFEPDAKESTFITLRNKEGTQTFWGKELAGLLRETNLKPGRMVTLQWMGEQPVNVKVPQKDDNGVVTHYKSVDTHRNQWSLAPVGGSRVQTGGDEMVSLSAFDVNRYKQVQHAVVSRLGLDMPPPPKPADGLYWLKPDGQGSATAGDPLSAPRPAHNDLAGTPVMSSWGKDGSPDLYLVQGDGNYLQGVVRQNGAYQHVLVSLPDSKEAPPMVVNVLTPEGAQPIGSGNGINRSNGQAIPREHVVVRLTGDAEPRIAKLDVPAEIPPALHARLGYDERFKAETSWGKDQPAAAPQAAPVSPPRPAQ
ncbi:LPD7 domain-containing protein [Erwinia persicina]|uniref:LPD7 domain-containing protein n=1 Tax=Erwinia persicina TaxID=55211 RepID=UPI00177B6C52|nr:LPD7 domain-containing protein [Erwinia persicina]MBD8165388.1 helix-turn-helix domain-containing protein [Erwinia persicina]